MYVPGLQVLCQRVKTSVVLFGRVPYLSAGANNARCSPPHLIGCRLFRGIRIIPAGRAVCHAMPGFQARPLALVASESKVRPSDSNNMHAL